MSSSASAEANALLVENGYAAFARGDIPSVFAVLYDGTPGLPFRSK